MDMGAVELMKVVSELTLPDVGLVLLYLPLEGRIDADFQMRQQAQRSEAAPEDHSLVGSSWLRAGVLTHKRNTWSNPVSPVRLGLLWHDLWWDLQVVRQMLSFSDAHPKLTLLSFSVTSIKKKK